MYSPVPPSFFLPRLDAIHPASLVIPLLPPFLIEYLISNFDADVSPGLDSLPHLFLRSLNGFGQRCMLPTRVSFSKAFDSVNHTATLFKLSSLGIPMILIIWLAMYLSNYFYVSISCSFTFLLVHTKIQFWVHYYF